MFYLFVFAVDDIFHFLCKVLTQITVLGDTLGKMGREGSSILNREVSDACESEAASHGESCPATVSRDYLG